jgi:hypothetical protein
MSVTVWPIWRKLKMRQPARDIGTTLGVRQYETESSLNGIG